MDHGVAEGGRVQRAGADAGGWGPASLPLLVEVLENLPDAVTLSTALRDEDGVAVDMRLDYMNARARASQPDPDAAIGGRCRDLWPGMVENGSFQRCMDVLNTGVPASGSFDWRDEETFEPAGYDYRAVRIGQDMLLWVLRDNTEELRASWALAASEERYRTVLAALDEGIVVQDANRQIVAANAAAERILGSTFATVPVGADPLRLVVDEDGRPLAGQPSAGDRVLATGKAVIGKVIGVPRPDGESFRWLSVNVYPVSRPGDDRPYATVSTLNDVTEQRALEAELKYLALHDPLTQLPNRTLLFDRMNQAMRRSRRGAGIGSVALCYLALDRFKRVNEQFGHEAGDRVLQEVAMRLLTHVREQDTVGRLGNDEFVVVLEGLSAGELPPFAAYLRSVVEEPVTFETGGELVDIPVATSIGWSSGQPRDSARDLLLRAERAMNQAKQARCDSTAEPAAD